MDYGLWTMDHSPWPQEFFRRVFSQHFLYSESNLYSMVKVTDLREGDIVHILETGALDTGPEKIGMVVEISREEKMAYINNGTQEFWNPPEQIAPIPLTDKHLVETLGFEKENGADGMKYKKGPFRLVIHDPGNNTHIDMWYREDRRHFGHPLYVHELQNLHMDMTKVPLEATVIR